MGSIGNKMSHIRDMSDDDLYQKFLGKFIISAVILYT